MNDLPMVSIVTPSLNQAEFIEDTILSVLQQGYPNLEYLVVDGKSTDGTIGILRKYEARGLKWISESDAGQSVAINKGFSMCEGEIIAWLNSDDTYEPGAVGKAVNVLLQRPEANVLYGNCNIIDRDGNFIGPGTHVEPFNVHRFLEGFNFVAQPATFFWRSAFIEVGGLDENLHYTMDWDLWLNLAQNGYQFLYIPDVLANVRLHPMTKYETGRDRRLMEILRILYRYGGVSALTTPRARRYVRRLILVKRANLKNAILCLVRLRSAERK